MSYFYLVWRNLMRAKFRNLLAVLSIVVAFVLFGLLAATNKAFNAGIDLAGEERLTMRNKIAIIQPLPYAYQGRIQAADGVDTVTHASWFGGVYQDQRNFFAKIAVEPEAYLDLYPEIILPEDQRKAWLATRTGAVIGKDLATRFGFEVGDRVPIQGDIYRKPDGSAWEFDIVGIYEGETRDMDETQLFFHYDYLKEGMGRDFGLVGWYIVRVDDPKKAATVAMALDDTFANSSSETKTETEAAFIQGFANQIGNTGAIIRGVLAAVFFSILLVVGNNTAQIVRERTKELGVLKALGFTDGKVLGLVLAESCLLAVLGGFVGLLLAAWIIPVLGEAPMISRYLPTFYLPGRDLAIGALFVLALGLITGIWPALEARRLQVAEALRRS